MLSYSHNLAVYFRVEISASFHYSGDGSLTKLSDAEASGSPIRRCGEGEFNQAKFKFSCQNRLS